MKRESGAARIFRYNWPIYVATWAAAGTAFVLGWVRPAGPVLWLLAGAALTWSVVSLLVSRHVYDRSGLAQGALVPPLLPAPMQTWATLHAGLDAEIDLDAVMPGHCVGRLDIFDARYMGASSVRRARQMTAPTRPSVPCSPVSLALPDRACDAVIVAFTAHEVRDPDARERLFGEVLRILRPGGRALLVEHLRDLSNFLAFGPGFLHFLPRRAFLSAASRAGFAVTGEQRVTPWVMALVLERPE